MFKKTTRLLMCAGLLLAAGSIVAKADSVVYATTGGQMRQTLEKEFYGPFKEERAAPMSCRSILRYRINGRVSKP